MARSAPKAAELSARYLAHAGPVLVDSGPLIALFNGADRWHAPVLDWLRLNPAATLISTWPVATEVCALLARRIHNDCALDFLRWAQRGGITFDAPAEGSLTEVLRIRIVPPTNTASRCQPGKPSAAIHNALRVGHSSSSQPAGRFQRIRSRYSG